MIAVYCSVTLLYIPNVFLETENVSLSHLHLAQNMREEAKKLEDFREKQKEARKKVRCTNSIWYFFIYWSNLKCVFLHLCCPQMESILKLFIFGEGGGGGGVRFPRVLPHVLLVK